MRKAISLLVVLGLLFASWSRYSEERARLTAARAAINAQWTDLAADLNYRAELIPDLMATAGRLPQGRPLSDALSEARSLLASARTPDAAIAANTRLNGAIGKLILEWERPGPVARQDGVPQLQFQLAERENRIFQSRRRYNDAIKDYNVMLSRFPANLAGLIAGFDRNDVYFKTDIRGN